MTNHQEILRAIEAAPTMLYSADPAEMRSQDSFGSLAPDKPTSPEEEVATLIVATPDNFRRLLQTIDGVLGAKRTEADIDDVVRHESAHARAALRAGAITTHYGIRFFEVVDLSGIHKPYVTTEPFTWHSFDGETPALVHASVLAHPLVPSPGDIADIQGLGYSGIGEVGQRIYEANMEYDFGLPVPLSWNGSGSEDLEEE